MITLRQGSRGPHVIQLKRRLEDAGYPTTPGPSFDSDTDRAVRQFQTTHHDPSGAAADSRRHRGRCHLGGTRRSAWAARGACQPPGQHGRTHRTKRSQSRGARARREQPRGRCREISAGHEPTRHRVAMVRGVRNLVLRTRRIATTQRRRLCCRGGFAQMGRTLGYWRPREQDYRPPMGAIVIYTFSHTGIIVSGGEQTDQTVEGNTSSDSRGSQRDGQGVFQRTRSHRMIRGYVVIPDIVAN